MPELTPRILILLGTYLPGYKAGGPVRSIANLVETFGDAFAFRIITSDRDHHGKSPYAGVPAGVWLQVGKAEVMYLPPRWTSIAAIVRAIRRTAPDVLYINSLFSPLYSIFPVLCCRLKLVNPGTVLLAPRGELGAGALRLKVWKKFPFRKLTRWIGLHQSVLWHASTYFEAGDILAEFFGPDVAIAESLPVRTACDLPDRPAPALRRPARAKPPGDLRIVFLSRISRMKNLAGAVSMLHGLQGDVCFSIYGPMEDARYWEECREVITSLPANVRVEYRGEVPHDRVADCFDNNDLLFLPTHGENYGHVIAEALAAGCPVLISDRTPWRNLEEKGVGWDLPLDDPGRFHAVLQKCIDMPPEEFREFAVRAHQFALQHSADEEIIRSNRELLLFAIRYPASPVEAETRGVPAP
jgi:glycosyltransferase involved in cell wall biosynthesis